METRLLTNEEIIEALDRDGLSVSDAQLARWSKAGLLPENERKGKGRGVGTVWGRKPEALPRARIIARVLAQKGARLEDAAIVLLLNNYPLEASRLRWTLLALLSDIESSIRRRQTYLDSPITPDEKKRRMKDRLWRRFPSLGREIAALASSMQTVWITDPEHPFSLESMYRAVEGISDSELVAVICQVEPVVPALRERYSRVWESMMCDARTDLPPGATLFFTQPPVLLGGIIASLALRAVLSDVHAKGFGWLLAALRDTLPADLAALLDAGVTEAQISPGPLDSESAAKLEAFARSSESFL